MDLPFLVRIIRNVKHSYATRLKFGDKVLTPETKIIFEAKPSICSTIKDSSLLFCRKFSAFAVVVIV